jgi:hypothetical protein
MKQRVNLLLGAGVVAGLVSFMPTSSYASIIGSTNGITKFGDGTEAFFNGADPVHRDWYAKKAKKFDSSASNLLFKMTDQGFTYWTPVRPKSAKSGGVSTGEYIYENFTTKFDYDNDSSSSASLHHLWEPNPNITRNFKTVKFNIPKQANALSKKTMATIGKGVIRSDEINFSGHFKKKAGTWRFNGYTFDGAPSQNPFFPPDYTFKGVRATKWANYEDVHTNLFNLTIYDTWDWKNVKKKMIERLLDQNPAMKFKTVNQWMKILSLQTDPEINPATGKADGSYGGAVFAAYNEGGKYYKTFTLLGDKEDGDMNLNLERLVITEAEKDGSGNYPVVAEVRRKTAGKREYAESKVYRKIVPGQKYRIVSTVKNESQITSTKYKPTTTDAGYAINYNPSTETYSNEGKTYYIYNPDYDKEKKTATHSGKIGPGKSVTTVATFTMPNNLKPGSKVRFGSMIDDKHRKYGDNLDPDDDDLLSAIDVVTGNMKAVGVTLVDENGKEVANPLPGHRYKIRYKMKYTGPNMKTKTTVTIRYYNQRKLPDGSVETILFKPNSKAGDTKVSKDLVLKNRTTYAFDTKAYQWYEFPWIHTEAVLSSSVPGLNTNKNDDRFEKTWDQKYDLSIENLQIIPRTERDGVAADEKQHFGVSFTVNSEMPNEAKKDNYAQDVNIRININGQTQVVTEHIIPGKNREITEDVAMKTPIPSGNIVNAKVEVNFDQRAYESDHVGPLNNTAMTQVKTGTLYRDPWGVITNPTNNTTNTGAYVDDLANPKRPLPTANPSNSWTQTYNIHSWTAKKITYKGWNNSKTYSFYRYTPTSTYTTSVHQREDYRIKDVLFKSKLTTENGWGDNGWVSLLNDPGHAQVQAGYGYQIKMVVEYSTNAFKTEPVASKNSDGSGTFVRPENVFPNISRDAYFQTSDGKILSASGTHGTNPSLKYRIVRETPNQLTIEYTLRDSNTMGIPTPGRIYVSEDTPDGMYAVRAWTPMINGVPTKNKIYDSNGLVLYQPAPLIDIQGGPVSDKPDPLPVSGHDNYGNPIIDTKAVPPMHILVVGSNKDDLIDSVVQ